MNKGDKAPEFELKGIDKNGEEKDFKLSDFLGKNLVLYFYPKDDTPTCTIEANDFNDDLAHLADSITVVGVSRDDLDSHKKFKDKFGFPFNGLTFCAGSFGTNPKNDLPGIIRALPGRIHFAHIRNLHHFESGVFEEAAHLSSDGSFDLYEIVKALHDIGFEGPARPD